jgi:hypothetical protein
VSVAGGWTVRRSFAPVAVSAGLTAAGLVGGCDLVDVSFTDGGIVLEPRVHFDGGVAGEGVPLPVPGSRPRPVPTRSPDAGTAVATTACQEELVALGVDFTTAPQMNGHPAGRPDVTCTVDDPVWMQAEVAGVTFRPARIDGRPQAIYAACELAAALGKMARLIADRGVRDVSYLGIFGCRVVAGTSTLSEHGRGRAFDLAALRTGDGQVYTVLSDWEKNQPAPVTAAGRFLRETVEELYEERVFHIILTPDYNADHYNHVHLDLTPGGHLFR